MQPTCQRKGLSQQTSPTAATLSLQLSLHYVQALVMCLCACTQSQLRVSAPSASSRFQAGGVTQRTDPTPANQQGQRSQTAIMTSARIPAA